jgi:hypothetical protein
MPGLNRKRGICMSDLEGVMLSEYFLLQSIRRGGVADVYRARQNGEDSYEVAVKVYRPGYAQAENRQKDVQGENSVAGKPGFWMVDPGPVEWSPISRAKVNLVPLNADAYLSNQSVVIGPEVQSPAPQSAEKEGEHTEEKAQSVLAERLRKLLPVVVVILLLLGLLGALLSSFYFP